MTAASSPYLSEVYPVRRTDLRRFVLISAILHALVLIFHGLLPAEMKDSEVKPPIKVRYIPPEPPKKAKKPSTLIDAPKPQKIEKPRSSELLASHDSRAHSNRSRKKAREYQASKTTVPKVEGQRSRPPSRPKPVKPRAQAPIPLPEPARKQEVFPLADKGFLTQETPKAESVPRPDPQSQPGSSLALLDGFDPSKYADIETGKDDADDDEVISLDTTETKYASYFARIKHQIERVWDYPEEAARRGISGELTLRFQIQRDGDLMDVRLIEGSGSELLDFAAIRAIKSAAPFYPFPVTIEKEKISILATFIYSPSYGAARRRYR